MSSICGQRASARTSASGFKVQMGRPDAYLVCVPAVVQRQRLVITKRL